MESGKHEVEHVLWANDAFWQQCRCSFPLLCFMSSGRRLPATLSFRLQCQLFSIFSFGSSAWLFYVFWRGGAFASLCLQLAVLFLVQTLLLILTLMLDEVWTSCTGRR